ncbi:MAG: hypothetical protein WC975_04320 [Phycisphaerae bacterium]
MEVLIVGIVFLFVLLALAIIILGPVALVVAGIVLITKAVSGGKSSAPPGSDEVKPLTNGNLNEYLQERRRILDMVAGGQVSPEDGERLLAALEQKGIIAQGQGLLQQSKMNTNWFLIIAGIVLLLFVILPVLFQLLAIAIPRARLQFPNLNNLPTLPAIPTMGIGLGVLTAGHGIISLLLFAFWIWMLVDCIRRPTDSFQRIAPLSRGAEYDKIIWLIGLIVLSLIAAAVYFLVIYHPARKMHNP